MRPTTRITPRRSGACLPLARPTAAQALLVSLVESSNDAIFSRDLKGLVISWNQAAERIFGYRADEILGRSNALLVPADRKDELVQLMRQIRRGERIEQFETIRLHKDGRPLYVSLSVSPLRGPRGQVIGSSTIARDTTAERELEAEVLEAAERERRRLGRDLHDGLGQQLGGMELLARSLARSLGIQAISEAKTARLLVRQIQATSSQVRALARGLTPILDESKGLMFALEELASTTSNLTKIRCQFICEEPVLFHNLTAAVNLLRIAQEAVGNATRHGRPRRIEIRLSSVDNSVRLEVCNDGRPLKIGASRTNGMGQRIMAYRARTLGGTVALESARPRGVRVLCLVPFPLPEN